MVLSISNLKSGFTKATVLPDTKKSSFGANVASIFFCRVLPRWMYFFISPELNASGSKKLKPEITDYAENALRDFYDYDLDTVLSRAGPKIAEPFTLELLEAISDQSHETAQPQNAVKFAHLYNQENDIKSVSIHYNVPNAVGHEAFTITLTYDEITCCNIIGLHLDQHLGDEYKMPELK